MPFIVSRVSVPITKEQETELKAWMGRAIELVPGKSEDYLLLDFRDNCRLWLRGDDSRPAAYIEAAVFGNEGHAGDAAHVDHGLVHADPAQNRRAGAPDQDMAPA